MNRMLENLTHILSDKLYLKLKYYQRMGKKLNLDSPKTFNEKLQWLKLYDRNTLYTKLVDKYEVREYIVNSIGEEYLIPLIGVWDDFDDIDFGALPNKFVLKCTHDSGGIVICEDKTKFDIYKTRKKIKKCLSYNYYWHGREWSYKNIKPRIIIEQYMSDEDEDELKDYKFFCFDGVPKAMYVATDRNKKDEETKFDFFDMDFNHMPFTNGHPNAKVQIKSPDTFEKMKELASRLSKGIPQVRVDFYSINGRIYFGELTLSHWSGFTPFEPEEWDYKFGEWVHLP